MSLEREDFQKLSEEKKRERVRSKEREFRQMAQAAAPAEALTGSAEWDYFVTLLQANIEMLENTLGALQDSSVDDASFEYSDLARRKAQEMQLTTQIRTLESVRDLPKQIIERGEKAKLVLQQYADE